MLPSSLLHFRHHNNNYNSHIEIIEDSLRALTLLLPGRFEDADLCSQAILTGLNLVTLYNTKYIIKKAIKNESLGSFNDRFLQLTRINRCVSWTLSVISYTEVVFEMLLSRRIESKTTKWKWITGLEGLKAILRLILYYGTKKQIVLHPNHLIRSVDPASLETSEEDKLELITLDPRNGTALSINDNNSDYKISKSNSKWAQFSEILWIIRPLIYTSMILLEQRKQNNVISREKEVDSEEEEEEPDIEKEEEGSWKPWIVSLCIDIISRLSRQPTNHLELEESKRRDYLFIYYLFRGPVYLKLTRLLLDKFSDATEHRPFISIITAAINDYRPFWEDSYFYTSGS